MNYWPAEPANLAECVQPLVAMVKELAITGARTARVNYGARGWVAHHNTDLWRATAPDRRRALGHVAHGRRVAVQAPVGPLRLRPRPRVSSREVYPRHEGRGAVLPRYAGRRTHPAKLPGHQSVRSRPRTRIAPARRSARARPWTARSCATCSPTASARRRSSRRRATSAQPAPPRAPGCRRTRSARPGSCRSGWRIGTWKRPSRDHRHVSHLYGLFPSEQITCAARPSWRPRRNARSSCAATSPPAGRSPGASTLGAAARRRATRTASSNYCSIPRAPIPNMFDAHPPFQIDGNFGGANGITEMLLQSPRRRDRAAAGAAARLAGRTVRGLRARGGFEVDIAWREGELSTVNCAARPAAWRGCAIARW